VVDPDDVGAVGTATALDDRGPTGADPVPSSGSGGLTSAGQAATAADAPSGRRGPLVFMVVAVAAIVVIGGVLLFGRSSDGAAPGPATMAAAPTTSAPKVVVDPEAVATERREAMCEAAATYALDDLLKLGDNIVASPDGFLAAYETLAVNVPGRLQGLVDQMGPLTRKAVAAVKSGELTTPAAVQAWLVATPAVELEVWVGAQQVLAPELVAACS